MRKREIVFKLIGLAFVQNEISHNIYLKENIST